MNYNEKENICRCDIFRPSGKWYETIAIEFETYFNKDKCIYDSFEKALYKAIGQHYRNQGFYAVCLEPYHEYSHPLMIVIS